MRISKKILAIALSILMAVSMMPFTVFAAEEPTVTWYAATENIQIGRDADQSNPYDASYTKDAITVSATSEEGHTFIDGTRFQEAFMGALSGFVFTNSVANFSKIKLVFTDLSIVSYNQFLDSEYNADPYWSSDLDSKTVTWEGDSNSVGLYAYGVEGTLDRIEFTYEEPAPVLPTATVTEISVDGLEKAYSFKADETAEQAANSAYKDYIADFEISFDKDVKAGDVQLGGSYQAYKDGEWVFFTLAEGLGVSDDTVITAGTKIQLLKTALANQGFDSYFTYYDIVSVVNEFKCGVKGLDAAGVTMTVDFNLYENAAADAVTIAEEEYTFPIDTTLPTATVTPIDVDGLETAYLYVADQSADVASISSYKNYLADFVVTFDSDIKAGAVQLGGSYEAYKDGEWVFFTLAEALGVDDDYVITQGTEIRLLETALTNLGYDAQFTYEDIVKTVGEFKCGAKGLDAAGVTMTVDFNLYENAAADAVTIAEEEYTFPIDTTLPTATVTPIDVDGLETAYLYVADQSADVASISSYKNYLADFVVTFDSDIKAGAVQLGGSYEAYKDGEWVFFTLAEALGVDDDYVITQGTEIRLLETALTNLGYDAQFTYEDIVKTVGSFKCGANGLDAAGVTMNVALNLYENAAADAVTIAEEEYTFPTPSDEYSITISDRVELNIYVDKTAGINSIKVTNSYAGDESATKVNKTYTGDELAATEVDGKYRINVPLAPAQIRDEITLDLLKADGTQARPSITKSIADYCEEIVDAPDAKVANLAKATLDYGKAAADYFNYNTAAFASQPNYLGDCTFGEIAKGSAKGITVDTVTYVATSVPELRFYVSGLTEETAAGKSVEANGYEAQFAKLADGQVVLQVAGIPASKLGEEVSAVINGSEDEYVKYVPLRWAMNAAQSNNAKLAALGNAIGNYSAAAAAYFG